MNLLSKLMRGAFIRDDEGSTAVEYSVMIALIIVVCIASIRGIGGTNGSLWSTSVDTISSEMSAAGS